MLNKLQKINKLDFINYLIILYGFTLSFPGEFKRVLTLLLLLILLFDKNKPTLKFSKQTKNLLYVLGIFFTYILISFIWTDSTIYDNLNYLRKYWYLLSIIPILIYLKKENITKAISFFLLGIFISEILSYGNYFAIWEIGKGNSQNPTVFMYHIFYSIFLALSSLILLIKILTGKERKLKIIFFVFFVTVTANLLLNIGRTGQITLILSIIIIILLHFKFKLRYLIYTLSSLGIILIANYEYNSIFKNRIDFIKSDITNILENNNYNTSLGGRIGFWILSKELLSKDTSSLILGIGAKQNIIKSKELINNKYPELHYNKSLKHFHSTYLSLLTQFGIIGITLFLIIMFYLFRLPIKNEEIKLIRTSVLLVFLISSLVDVPFYKDVTLALFAYFIAITLVQNRIEFKDNVKEFT